MWQMSMQDKIELLNELAEPFGFSYVPEKDIFIGRVDAWQRHAGYKALFDKAAAHFNMIFDAWPVYFDYEGRTWLIELWKGQYGINTGAEIGVYHADKIVAPDKRKWTHFETADDEEMPIISYCLDRCEQCLFCIKRRHWWLASFRMGLFSNPSDLHLMATLTFRNPRQAESFLEGLKESEYSQNEYQLCFNEVHVCMDGKWKYSFGEKLHRGLVQLVNWISCSLYRFVTRPFLCTVDRMLFLYFQLPGCFRKMMRLSSHERKRRV